MESKLPYSFGVEINAISALSIIFGSELQTSFVFTRKFTVWPSKACFPQGNAINFIKGCTRQINPFYMLLL